MDYLDYIKAHMEKNGATLWDVSRVFMDPDAEDLLKELTVESNKKYSMNAPMTLVKQWTPLFIQLELYQRDNLQNAIEHYEYPPGIPNLTKDRTKDFTVDLDNRWILSNQYLDDDGNPELIETPWQVKDSRNDHQFMFGNRFVVMPDDRVLMFD
ncbi:hypothetical protein [Endozoicomonas ascidiicola]|uniref:hypothetical protein n=1 Tax=Endozoicomonas ascidiicola TaxID=1698521 RepID=UPI000831C741|nr:hypothetical protein [Endozoicomonas ascidiicola]